MFDVLKGTPLAEDMDSVLDKLQQRATRVERAQLTSDRDRFAYVPDGGTKVYRGKEDVLDALQSGVLLRNVVAFSYRGANQRLQRGFLAPFSMLLFKHGLYVIGRTLASPKEGQAIRSGAPEIFAAERFTSAEWLREHSFSVPTDFKLDDLLQSAFELHVAGDQASKRVVIEFSKERAAYVRARQWHRSQTLREQADGSVVLSFICANFAPVVSWVLEWGPHALVLEPPELVDIVAAELEQAHTRYRAKRGRLKAQRPHLTAR
jgi:predicted DNA-binding transcriptional regulator YafY